jgi:hypothetical protein
VRLAVTYLPRGGSPMTEQKVVVVRLKRR